MLEVIEERVKVNGVEFTKSELIDIRSFLTLTSGKYLLNTKAMVDHTFSTPDGVDADGKPKFSNVVKKISVSVLIRKSVGMQKALNNDLLTVIANEIMANEKLVDAFSRYAT